MKLNLKKLFKKIIPMSIVRIVTKRYSRYVGKLKTVYSKAQYDALPGLNCTAAYNKHGGYIIPLSSSFRPAPQKIIDNQVHEPDTIEYMLAHCEGGDIVHAGTYFGDFLPALSHGCAAGSVIWAFEPNPENYQCAHMTMLMNNLKNVSLMNAGLGAAPETLQMKTTDASGLPLGGGSRVLTADSVLTENMVTVTVDIVTIDDVVDANRHVTVIQLDVEDHEQEALGGALKTIARCLPILIIEVLPQSKFIASNWFVTNIINLGYQQKAEVHGNLVFHCK